MKSVPFKIISNAHGWWGNDFFKYYLATCLNNNSKYIDVQHNGTYFILIIMFILIFQVYLDINL